MDADKLWEKANTLIPGGSHLLSKNKNLFSPEEWPTYYKKAKGVYTWDLSGKKYIDFASNGIGACSLGFGNRSIDRYVKKTIDIGVMSSLNAPEEVELAEKLIGLHPWAEMARFARTGGEANAIAIRIARAYTKRDKVAICGYHGWHDWYLSTNLTAGDQLENHLLPGLGAQGVPKGLSGTTVPINYNNFEDLEKLNDEDIGVLKMEVVRTKEPKEGFLEKIREICTKKGIVLIFDECTSGFRETNGGIHKKYGVEPDMAIFGKAIGNGYAITSVIGKGNIMNAMLDTFVSSTFWTERIGTRAAIATLKEIERQKSWKKIPITGNRIRKIWESAAHETGLELITEGIDGLPTFRFLGDNAANKKTGFTERMLKHGILATTQFYPTTEHKEKHIARYERAVKEIFREIRNIELKGNTKDLCKGRTCSPSFRRLN